MVPAKVVDSLASALRGRRSTLSYAGMIGAGRKDRAPEPGRQKNTNGRDQRSLPETTVCRPTEGDQYRISGPSYVLAGTAILNPKNASRHHATSQRARFSAG